MRRNIALIPLMLLPLSQIAASDQGCAAPTFGRECGFGDNPFNCRCTLDLGNEKCHSTAPACAPDATTAQTRTVNGQQGVTCACTPSGEPPPAYPQTIGGDPMPLCSDVMGSSTTTGAGGAPLPTCGQAGDVCDVPADCCSGLCTLNACE